MVGNGSQLSEAQLAARHAMSHALNMPIGASGNSLKSFMTNISVPSLLWREGKSWG